MPLKVIYVIGCSFSGSTILGALLGGQPGNFCAGELGNWTTRPGSQELPCSCGTRRVDCPFWCEVRAEWLQASLPDWGQYRSLQKRFERMRRIPFLSMERSLQRVDFDTYLQTTQKLYQVLQQVSGMDTVIDISKRVGRARTLGCIADLDISYIHLVRDGRGYLNSSLRHKQKKVRQPGRTDFFLRAILEWVMTNRMAEKVIAGRSALRVRYEDFARDPIQTLDRISTAFSLDLSAVQEHLAQGKQVDFGHMGGGNQLRLAGPAEIRLDESWKESLPPSARRMFWALAGGTARRYGYDHRGTG